MALLANLVDDVLERISGRRFDPRLVGGHVIDLGPAAERARGIAARLNAARTGRPKEPVVLWTSGHAAVTRRGPWVYVARGLAGRLSDDGLAFVLAHEMAHHDLGHLRPPLAAAALMGHAPRMELMADAYAVRLAYRAGFDPRGAVEAFDPELWADPPEDASEDERDVFRAWVGRMRRTHPPMSARRAAIRATLRQLRPVGFGG